MKIKKVAQTPGVLATVSTSKIDSDKDTYSCNYLNDNAVVVSPTEPSDGKVWLQKGKNLFDVNKISEKTALVSADGSTPTSSASNVSDYIEVKANKTYILTFNYDSLTNSSNRAICYFDKNKAFLSGGDYYPSNKRATITPTQDGYIRFGYDQGCYNIQLEQGETVTSYEPYIDKKIHTKNDNGIYEEFYNAEPKRRVVWTNSKPTSSMGYVAAIYLDSAYVHYDELEFWCYGGTDNTSFQVSKTKPGYSTTVIGFGGYAGETVGRSFTYRSDGGYSIGDCYIYGPNFLKPPSASNSNLIPAFIVAIKY